MVEVVDNFTQTAIKIIGSLFVAFVAVRFFSHYVKDNEVGMGKSMFWTVICAIFIFSGLQIVDAINDTAKQEIFTDQQGDSQ